MKTVLCYGDSNTYGYVPETGMRYPIYAKIGFKDKEHRYRDMRYKF